MPPLSRTTRTQLTLWYRVLRREGSPDAEMFAHALRTGTLTDAVAGYLLDLVRQAREWGTLSTEGIVRIAGDLRAWGYED